MEAERLRPAKDEYYRIVYSGIWTVRQPFRLAVAAFHNCSKTHVHISKCCLAAKNLTRDFERAPNMIGVGSVLRSGEY